MYVRACKICLKKFKKLRYDTERMAACGHCINSLNDYKEVAKSSYDEAGERLRRGIKKRLKEGCLPHQPEWLREESKMSLENFEVEYDSALSRWLNKLAADPNSYGKIHKTIRAERRGLIYRNRPNGWGYPSNWAEVARRIRALDNYTCVICNAQNVELHVHHLVYVSNFGTHRKQNLMTLCKRCHQIEHKRAFDFGESKDGLEEVIKEKHHIEICSDDLNKADQVGCDTRQVKEVYRESNITPSIVSALKVETISTPDKYPQAKDQIIREGGVELINLKRVIVDGEDAKAIQNQIVRVKSRYVLTDNEVIGRMAGISDGFVMSLLRENIRALGECDESQEKAVVTSLKSKQISFDELTTIASSRSAVSKGSTDSHFLADPSAEGRKSMVELVKEYWPLLLFFLLILFLTTV